MNGRTNVTTGTNADDIVVPLDSITNFSVIPGNGFVSVQWTDPKDKYATPEGEIAQDPQQLVSEFDYTIIVRKIGSSPVDFKDGEVSVLSSIRNQYSETAYVDSGVTYDETYYYAAWVFNKDGIKSDGVFADPVTPKYYDSILENNTWDRINEACTNGLEQSLWEVGDTKSFMAVDQQLTGMILDFNHDDLSDDSGKASITFIIAEGLPGNGAVGSYDYTSSNGRKYLMNSVLPTINDDLSSQLKTIRKLNQYGRVFYDGPQNGTNTNDKIFLFSCAEVGNWKFDGISFSDGYQYPYFETQANRARGYAWRLRTGYRDQGVSKGFYVPPNGNIGNYFDYGTETAVGDRKYVFGFCIGKLAA